MPPAHVAAVVTSLEMRSRPPLRPAKALPADFELKPFSGQSLDAYRTLFRMVGADWLWFSRLAISDAELKDIIENPQVEIFTLRVGGSNIGILELDFRQAGECELAHFGLTANIVGKGLGRTLMTQAIIMAWSKPITRFWVHTCTFDHPEALDFYRRSGFIPYAFQVEVAPDPRLSGLLPRDCAPHIPLLR